MFCVSIAFKIAFFQALFAILSRQIVIKSKITMEKRNCATFLKPNCTVIFMHYISFNKFISLLSILLDMHVKSDLVKCVREVRLYCPLNHIMRKPISEYRLDSSVEAQVYLYHSTG